MSPRKTIEPTQLGNHIIRRRKKKDWSTADLAREANIPYTTLRNIEKGASKKPDVRILRAIIKALGLDEGVVFAYAGYGTLPTMSRDELTVSLDALGEVAPDWLDLIERVKKQPPEQQNQMYAVLLAQLNAANHYSKDHQ